MAQLDISSDSIVAKASLSERQIFIKRTYLHVAGSIAVFALLEATLIQMGFGESFLRLLSSSSFSWLIVLALFMGVSYIADKWARNTLAKEMQYAGLGLFIVAESVVFLPLIYMALQMTPDGSLLSSAAVVTGALVLGITFTAFTTKKDFSFIGKYLVMGGFAAMGIIVAAILFGFKLGLFFSGAMIIFAGFSILYSTSNIIHQYHTSQHVAAALSLFASVALLFWYVLQFLMALAGGDD